MVELYWISVIQYIFVKSELQFISELSCMELRTELGRDWNGIFFTFNFENFFSIISIIIIKIAKTNKFLLLKLILELNFHIYDNISWSVLLI